MRHARILTALPVLLAVLSGAPLAPCAQAVGHDCADPLEFSEPALLGGPCAVQGPADDWAGSPQRLGGRLELPRMIVVRLLPEPVPSAPPLQADPPSPLRPQHAHRNGTRAPQRC